MGQTLAQGLGRERSSHMRLVSQLQRGSQAWKLGRPAQGPMFSASAPFDLVHLGFHHMLPSSLCLCPSLGGCSTCSSLPGPVLDLPLFYLLGLRLAIAVTSRHWSNSGLSVSLSPGSCQPQLCFQCFPQGPDICLFSVKTL